MESFTEKAILEGHLRIDKSGKADRVVYVAGNRTERWTDPEEKVRAEFYAELIYRYGYDPERIGVEITVPDRTPKDAADIIVFRDAERKRPYAVIECKREGISDAEFNQSVEQAWGNGNAHKFRAAYVGVVAGGTRRFLDCSDKFGALERDKNQIADLPLTYGNPPEYKYRKGVSNNWQDIKPVNKGELIAAIKKCHQTLWGGGRLSPPAAFGEFCKIIFVKVRDEKAPRKKGDPYEFQIKTDEPSPVLAKRIKDMYAKEMQSEPDVFTEPIKIDDGTLKMCVAHLEGINFNKTDLDTKGVAFEQFLDGFFKGDFGQYFTPREIIQFCVEMMKPTKDDFVLDPACGSGGFLLYAMDYLRHEAENMFDDEESDARFRHWHDFAKEKLFGLEINDEISRVAKMNMILHDDGHTHIYGNDALDRLSRIGERNRRFQTGMFDLILTNPPFGAVIKETEKGSGYMEGWELLRYIGKGEQSDGSAGEMVSDFKAGKKSIKARKSIKTEILFCERVWHFLKPGTGRAAIVLPDGILTNSSLRGVRDWLLLRFQLLAVVSLPQEAFQHAGAGVKASVVFFRKRAEDEQPDDDEAIFMAAPANIGYDATGRKTARVSVKSENGRKKVEIHATDLFDVEVLFEKAAKAGTGEEEWQEKTRRVVAGTGVLGQYRAFEKTPESFFV
ncbi:MAG: N-6 DNA methylase [Candidatus Hydrogenedentes bacterium]|nr:N-6 DNA methylase [Candidatus Hydrogenedentota bacterium]